MKIFHGSNQIKRLKDPVVAMGVFDGVHRGHIGILKAAVRKACAINGTSVALTFWPHPQKEESLYSLEHRLRLFKELGIDACAVMNFSSAFRKIPAQEFIKETLVKKIGAKYIFVGDNFRFGKDAAGDCRLLKASAKRYGFKLKAFPVIREKGRAISSTYIRNLIRKGKFNEAETLLGRPVGILGSVIRGYSLGRRLGFPTANINPHHEVIPPAGIYAVRLMLAGRSFDGTCYIGFRPTFEKSKTLHIETHLFNFKRNIYGEDIEVRFVKKIRNDRKFASAALLAKQISKDNLQARRILSLHPQLPQYIAS